MRFWPCPSGSFCSYIRGGCNPPGEGALGFTSCWAAIGGNYHTRCIIQIDTVPDYTDAWPNCTSPVWLISGDPASTVPSCQYDLWSVITHELGHAMRGFHYSGANVMSEPLALEREGPFPIPTSPTSG
jgi:hypothetical protein